MLNHYHKHQQHNDHADNDADGADDNDGGAHLEDESTVSCIFTLSINRGLEDFLEITLIPKLYL